MQLRSQQVMYDRNLFLQFSNDLVVLIESITISDCSALSLNLSAGSDHAASPNATTSSLGVDAFSGPIDVEVSNVESVELVLRNSNRFLRHLFMDNVAYVETLLESSDGTVEVIDDGEGEGDVFWMTTEELYLYIIIVLGALLLITWTAIPIAVLCAKKGRYVQYCPFQ